MPWARVGSGATGVEDSSMRRQRSSVLSIKEKHSHPVTLSPALRDKTTAGGRGRLARRGFGYEAHGSDSERRGDRRKSRSSRFLTPPWCTPQKRMARVQLNRRSHPTQVKRSSRKVAAHVLCLRQLCRIGQSSVVRTEDLSCARGRPGRPSRECAAGRPLVAIGVQQLPPRMGVRNSPAIGAARRHVGVAFFAGIPFDGLQIEPPAILLPKMRRLRAAPARGTRCFCGLALLLDANPASQEPRAQRDADYSDTRSHKPGPPHRDTPFYCLSG